MEKISFTKGIAGFALAAAVFSLTTLSSYAAEGKVTADTAKIRAEASTGSEVVGSTAQGKVIELLGAVKDSSGMTWYKVSVAGGGYGYIRSDLVSTNDTVPTIESSSNQTTTQSTQTSEPEATVPTSIGEQQATIKSETNARIRSGASTQHSVVTSLPNGTNITLIGEANDSAGNKWYQLKCNYNGRDVEGYVRSDLITIGGAAEEAPAETEETPAEGEQTEGMETPEENVQAPVEETPAEPVEEHNDYEIVYTQNNEGAYEYYLYDNINGTRQKLAEILAVVDNAVESNNALQEKVNQNKLIIIILAVIIAILFIALTIVLLKLRECYYEEYDEEEEEEEFEEEPEPAPVRKKARRQVEEEEETEEVPVKKKRVRVQEEEEVKTRKSPAEGQRVKVKREEDAELYAAEKKAPAKKAPARKAQNFLVDDDEFEFEFLNMDDKDL
jgi:uncharacterized protein YgiM (DUF1202 family)